MGQRFESWGVWCRAAGAVEEPSVGRMILGIVCGLTGPWRKQTPTCSSLRYGQSLPHPSLQQPGFVYLFSYLFPKAGFPNLWSRCVHSPVACSCSQHTMLPLCDSGAFPGPTSAVSAQCPKSAWPHRREEQGDFTPEHSSAKVPCVIVAFYSCSPDAVVKLCLLDSLVTWEVSASLCR